MGPCANAGGALAQAVQTAESALAARPPAPLRLATADAFRAAGNRDRAIDETRHAIRSASVMPEASFNLGVLLANGMAAPRCSNAVRERPGYPAASTTSRARTTQGG